MARESAIGDRSCSAGPHAHRETGIGIIGGRSRRRRPPVVSERQRAGGEATDARPRQKPKAAGNGSFQDQRHGREANYRSLGILARRFPLEIEK